MYKKLSNTVGNNQKTKFWGKWRKPRENELDELDIGAVEGGKGCAAEKEQMIKMRFEVVSVMKPFIG